MKLDLSRRKAIALITAAGAASACAQPDTAPETTEVSAATQFSPRFKHGVASGDPMLDSVVLWTRIESDADAEPVQWDIAESDDFNTIIQSGTQMATAEADHTVKVIPTGLEAGKTYYYRFRLEDGSSPTGRTKTLPSGSVDELGIALASCSNYAFGFFNAYDAIAKDEDVDFVLHTGDYIYEYGGSEGWGHETASVIGRTHAPAREIVSLADYRERHAQYKSDAGSLAMHAAHPLIACWDDHESANNPWLHGAQNHDPETEGDWETRRAASLQAYYEWMPIREPGPGMTRADFWRTYTFGDLATLITLETRHTARGEQVDLEAYATEITSPEARDDFMATVIDDPDRKMISTDMEEAIRTGLSASVEAGQVWRLFGNASPIARMLVPDVAALGIDASHIDGGEANPSAQALFWKGKWNLPFYTDTWDGYPAARERLYDLCQSVGASDLVFLTGDSHSFWANSLYDDEGKPVGVELGTAGITSPGDFVESGWDIETAKRLDQMFADQLDEVEWTDNMHQGYVRVVINRSEMIASFVAVDTVLQQQYRVHDLRTVKIAHSGQNLEYVEGV